MPEMAFPFLIKYRFIFGSLEYNAYLCTINNFKTYIMPRPLYKIANEISKDWGAKVNYGAKPYLVAMFDLTNVSDYYYMDSGSRIVGGFLSSAGTWRGETARRVKKELNAMIK